VGHYSSLAKLASSANGAGWASWSWAIWLAVPVAITLLAAAFIWWRGRPPRPLRTPQTIAGHDAYLKALGGAAARAGAATEEAPGSPS